MRRKTQAVARENDRMLAFMYEVSGKVEYSAVGRISATAAIIISDDSVFTTFELNLSTRDLPAAATRQAPRTCTRVIELAKSERKRD